MRILWFILIKYPAPQTFAPLPLHLKASHNYFVLYICRQKLCLLYCSSPKSESLLILYKVMQYLSLVKSLYFTYLENYIHK